MKREFLEIELKDQSKRRMRSLNAISLFGGLIHDQYESKYFSGKQAWRNPLVVRVSLPEGKRWEYISYTIALGCGLWVARPSVCGVPEMVREIIPRLNLRGDHKKLSKLPRRNYCFHAGGWIADFRPGASFPISEEDRTIHYGSEIVTTVLNGEIDFEELRVS